MAKTKNQTLKGTGKKYKGSDSASVIDKIKVYGQKNTVYARKGNDQITVYKGSKHKIYGGDGKDKICFLQAFFGESCKMFLEKIASPFWRKLQRPVQSLREPQPATADIG